MNISNYMAMSEGELIEAYSGGDQNAMQAILAGKKYGLLNDEDLMLQFAGGSLQCFDCIYERHKRKLIRFVNSMVNNEALADELAQEAWINIIDNKDKYSISDSASFRTWAYKVACNVVNGYFRSANAQKRGGASKDKKDKINFVSIDASDGDDINLAEIIADTSIVDAIEPTYNLQLEEAFKLCLEKLTEKQRQVIVLGEMDGISEVADDMLNVKKSEIARIIGLDESSVRSRLDKAKIILAECMQSKGFFEGEKIEGEKDEKNK